MRVEALEPRENPASLVSLEAVADTYEGGYAGVMVVSRENDLETEISVTVATSGTATAGSDYMIPVTINFAPYQVTANVQVFALEDSAQEPDETITYTLQPGAGYAVGTPDAATITLYDNDTPSTVTLVGMANPTEGGMPGLFGVNRTGALHQQITVSLSAMGGTAGPSDFQSPMSVTFAPWETEQFVIVTPLDDSAVEGTETITYSIMPMGMGYVAGTPNSATIDLLDNDLPTGLSVHVLEDAIEGSATNGTFRLTRTGDLTTSFQVNYTLGGTATSGSDYAPLGTLSFAPYQTSLDVTVAPVADGVPEGNETVSFTVNAGPGYAVGTAPVAVMQLVEVAPPPGIIGTGTGLFARYYNTKNLSDLKSAQVDTNPIKYDWGQLAPPGSGVGVDNFSIRWTGLVQAQRTDNYTFHTLTDDGVRLWVNGVLVINNWNEHVPTEDNSSPIPLVAGQKYEIVLEYFEAAVAATVNLSWTAASNNVKVIIPITQLYPVQFDLDVNKNDSLADAVDGADTYLPGYSGNEQVLTASNEQEMKLIATGLTPNTAYNVRLTNTTKYAGIASNADSVAAIYPSSNTDNDYVLVVPGSDPDELVITDDTDVSVTTSATGVLTIKIRARDFGGATTVKIRDANGVNVATLSLPRDGDSATFVVPGAPGGIASLPIGDKLADQWEDLYATVPAGFANFIGYDRAKVHSINNVADGARDDDRNEGGKNGKNVGDRLPAFDEYRGFLVSGVHKRTAPTIKQVFVYSPDKDPFTAVLYNEDGLNPITALGTPVGAGDYASDVDAEILLIQGGVGGARGEFDNAPATLGDVNYNSPAPYSDIKQKYVWVVTTLDVSNGFAGLSVTTNDLPFRGPNSRRPLNANAGPHVGKVAVAVHLGNLRTDIAFIDQNGSQTETGHFGGTAPEHVIMTRGAGGLDPHTLRDPNRHVKINGAAVSMFYFTAADKIAWHDRPGGLMGHWDRTDELWIDANSNGKFDANEKVIFDHDKNLQANTIGILVDNTTEFRYVRDNHSNVVSAYAEGDYIYTAYFNAALYIAARNQVYAHEIVGHPLALPHDRGTIMIDGFGNPLSYTANGIYYYDQLGVPRFTDPPTTFSDSHQNTLLQVRE